MALITISEFMEILQKVETGSTRKTIDETVGDNGKSLGPLQISKACFADAKEEYKKATGQKTWCSYKHCVNVNVAKMVCLWYFERYAKQSLKRMEIRDVEKLARIWNGGPAGYKKKATLPYWEKFKVLLDVTLKRNRSKGWKKPTIEAEKV